VEVQLAANGHPVDTSPEFFGELVDSSPLLGNSDALNERMQSDGYLLFRQLIEPATVLEARREILLKYAAIGEIDDRDDVMLAKTGTTDALGSVNLRAFSESVRSGYWYTHTVLNPALMAMYADLLGGEPQAYDFRWPRFVRPGEGCGFHCDGPYMNHGTDKLYSSWIPLGRVAPEDGSLIVLEDSHINPDLHAGYLNKDADADGLVWLDDDPVKVQRRYGKRWLTTTFEPGDVLCFSMSTLHGALDNQSPTGACRLTSDSRYQLASEPFDERWNGETIVGHGGSRVFYPGLGSWNNEDFQDEWKFVDESGRLSSKPLA
jgi:hypothetical protein